MQFLLHLNLNYDLVYQKFFQDNYFLVQEIFQDNFYGNANYNCTILPGKYRAIENNGLIKIIYN